MVLDESLAAHTYRGAVVNHRQISGARIARIMHPPGQRIAAHRHDWPVLTIYRIGAYRERTENGATADLDGPCVVFQPAGAAHEDMIGVRGLEKLAITFDTNWLGRDACHTMPRQTCWRSGAPLMNEARALARLWADEDADERQLRCATSRLLQRLGLSPQSSRPPWAQDVERLLSEANSTAAVAERLVRRPAWLTHAYRAWRGEGIAEAIRRRRLEHAVQRLRGTARPLAEIAAECGFCDQSHLNRVCKAMLGRTPLDVRREAALLAPYA